MNVITAIQLAHELMNTHGIYQRGWRFKFDNSKRRFGCCNHTHKIISLSRELTILNSEARVKNTLLHEIAHALVGSGHGHDHVWRAKAIEIGCDGERCYSSEHVNAAESKYKAVCQGCGREYRRHRKPKMNSSCGRCSGGRYNEKFKLTYKTNQNETITKSKTLRLHQHA